MEDINISTPMMEDVKLNDNNSSLDPEPEKKEENNDDQIEKILNES